MSTDAFANLQRQVERLTVRLTALEQHITTFGPQIRKSDPSIVGCPCWNEPYRPPTRHVDHHPV